MNIDFKTGEIYQNCIGSYMVMSLNGKTMDVEYVDGSKAGTTQTLDIAGQSKVILNRKAREMLNMKMRELNLKGKNESFTLGFLAKRALIFVRVKESSRSWFETTYKKLTSQEPPTPNVEGNYYTVVPDEVQGSGDHIRVMFQTPSDSIKSTLSFGNDSMIHWDSLGTMAQYNNMNYVLNLFREGFRLGKNHDVDTILARAEDKDAVSKGYQYREQEAA